MAPTIDQLIAKAISQDTPLPSLEVASETTVQSAAGGGGSYTTLSFRDPESPLPMEYNPRKIFLQLFGEGLKVIRIDLDGTWNEHQRVTIERDVKRGTAFSRGKLRL